MTKTWNGVSSTSWSDGANWTPAGTPVAGDDLVFPGGAGNLSNNNNIAAGTSFNSIAFTGASGGYSLGGNVIQLAAGGITANNTSGFNVVTFNIALAASQTFNLPAEVDLNGNLDLGASSASPKAKNIGHQFSHEPLKSPSHSLPRSCDHLDHNLPAWPGGTLQGSGRSSLCFAIPGIGSKIFRRLPFSSDAAKSRTAAAC